MENRIQTRVAADPSTPSVRLRRVRRIWRVLGIVLALAAAAFYGLWVYPFWGFPFNAQRHGLPPLTPAWALECWVWEDDVNTGAAVLELLEGYARHDLPVRAVLIDSPWSTRYNDFQVDTNRYPNPEGFFRGLQTNGYRVVLWMTSMINSRNRDTAIRDGTDFYDSARTRGYLAGGGHQVRWWKGRGAFLDYTNAEARRWWQSMQQPLFDWGLDGWKLDGTDTLFSGPGFLPYQRTAAGWMSTRAYMDAYNRYEFAHGRSRNPEFIVLTRAIDHRYFPLSHPEGFAPIDAAPVTWVGDRTHQWSSKSRSVGDSQDAMRDMGSWLDRGFEGALRDILASAAKGYGVVGADVAGYHGPQPIPPRLYIRWAQFAAFTGLFLNGGHGERRLWLRTPEELEIIRRYAWLHTELVPYLYTHVVRHHEGGSPLLRPAPGPYHYRLGDDLFIAPIYRDENLHTVTLPAGRWRLLSDDARVVEGPRTLTQTFALDDFPAYVRDGAILPLQVSRPYSGFGDHSSSNHLTWAIWPQGSNAFAAHLPDRSGVASVQVAATDTEVAIALSGTAQRHILRVHLPEPPGRVTADGRPLRESDDWRYDRTAQRLWIRQSAATNLHYRIAR